MLACLGLTLVSAQQVTVVEQTLLLGDEVAGYHPVLNTLGDKLLFTSMDNDALCVYDFGTGAVTQVSDLPGSGMDASWGTDGKVYYVAQERHSNNLLYRSVRRHDLSTAVDEEIVEAQHGAVLVAKSLEGTTAIIGKARGWTKLQPTATNVYTEGSEVVVTINGKEHRYSPVESWAGYLWSSISPDGTRVAFFAAGRGIVVIDLAGNVLAELGNYEMPCWYDNDYIIAQNATDDGYQFKSSQIMLLKADGTWRRELTTPTSMTMQPTAANGKIVYTTIDGRLQLMRIIIND